MSSPETTKRDESMEMEANPYETPIDAVVVHSPRTCPECGSEMEHGFVRTFALPWDDGRRPWWKFSFFRYEPLIRMPFFSFGPPKISGHLCRQCHVVVMDLEQHAR